MTNIKQVNSKQLKNFECLHEKVIWLVCLYDGHKTIALQFEYK